MTDQPLIYLDMDGVCCDFVSAALRINGFEPEEVFSRWQQEHRGEFHMSKVLDIKMETFWDHIHTGGIDFWRGLEAYPWFTQMHKELEKLGRVVFLSSPTRSPDCIAGKHHWLQDRFGRTFNQFIFTQQKDLLAHSNATLIDDYEGNITAFNDRQGHGQLFPRFWNARHHIDDDPCEYILQQCETWLRSRTPA